MKKTLSKTIAILLAVLTLFSAFQAFALTEGDEYSYSERYINAYYNTGRWKTDDGDVHDNHGQVALRNLPNGEPLYCIQIYKHCNGSDVTAENIADTTLWKYELSNSQKNFVKYVSIHGFPNFKYGYSDDEAQLATQVLLWEIETGARDDWSTGCDSWASSIFNNYPDALGAYNAIVSACADHRKTPDFNTTSIQLEDVGKENAVTLHDRNGVLENFRVSSTNSAIKVEQDGNFLKIWSTSYDELTGSIQMTKNKTDINSAFALTGANQTLFYGTLADPVNARITVKSVAKKGSAEFVKTDEETGQPVQATDGLFEIQEWNYSQDKYIDHSQMKYDAAKGKYVSETLKVTSANGGWFRCVEVKAPSGYVTDNTKIYEFRITQNGQVIDINNGAVTNAIQKGRIQIYKEGEVLERFDFMQTELGLKYAPVYRTSYLAGSEWNITAAEDIVANGKLIASAGDVVQTLTTTENGALSDLLYPGKYTVTEVTAPTGYNIGDNSFDVTIKPDDDKTQVVTETVTGENDRQTFEVTLQKALEQNEYYPNIEAYQSVLFGVYAAQDITDGNGNVILEKDSLVDCIAIDENGIGKTTCDFPAGFEWYVKELQTAEGYVIDDNIYGFSTAPGEQVETQINIDLNDGAAIDNALIRGSIKGIKKDNRGNKLEGATIGLFKDGETVFTSDTALQTCITNKDGEFSFNNLPYGKYIVKEIAAPTGYDLDDTQYTADIDENGKVIELTITDIMRIGRMELTTDNKISPYTGNAFSLLGGAVMAIMSLGAGIVLVNKRKDENEQ